jgi:hypothetical protein
MNACFWSSSTSVQNHMWRSKPNFGQNIRIYQYPITQQFPDLSPVFVKHVAFVTKEMDVPEGEPWRWLSCSSNFITIPQKITTNTCIASEYVLFRHTQKTVKEVRSKSLSCACNSRTKIIWCIKEIALLSLVSRLYSFEWNWHFGSCVR